MSTTKTQQQNDKRQDKSNVLSLLKSIERIYNLCQDVLNTYAQRALMLSLVIEAYMLLLKLKVMGERWQLHLPFKEACKVKFDKWAKKIEKMGRSFSDSGSGDDSEPIDEYCPSKHFLLDLYDSLPENTEEKGYSPYYKETSINRFLATQDQMRQVIADQWQSYYKQRFSDHVVNKLGEEEGLVLDILRDDDEAIADACRDVLLDLSVELYKLNELTEPDIQPEQFVRLAERVFYESDYAGRDARKNARRDVKQWKNKTPKNRREVTRKGEIDASIKIIRDMKPYGPLLADYIGEDYEIKGHSEGLGQFLHHVREDISVENLTDLMEQLYRIRFFRDNKEIEDAEKVAKLTAETSKTTEGDTQPSPKKISERPKLDHFFKMELSRDADATSVFYDILHRCERYMHGRFTKEEKENLDTEMYKRWKWNHLRVAFEKLGFIEEGTAKESFAKYIEKVFPNQTAEAVKRSIQRYKETATGFDSIVEEIVFEFEDVKEMIED